NVQFGASSFSSVPKVALIMPAPIKITSEFFCSLLIFTQPHTYILNLQHISSVAFYVTVRPSNYYYRIVCPYLKPIFLINNNNIQVFHLIRSESCLYSLSQDAVLSTIAAYFFQSTHMKTMIGIRFSCPIAHLTNHSVNPIN